MNVAIMQPYLFPWIGYFQLIYQSDVFVLYDDASYIMRGFINRNTILSDGKPLRFTVPVLGASQNKKIKDLSFGVDVRKLLKTIEINYKKSPFYDSAIVLVEKVLTSKERDLTFCCEFSINSILTYLGLEKKIIRSSDIDYDRNGSAEDKIISICETFNADMYVNNFGGRHLYTTEKFHSHGIKLCFMKGNNCVYSQGGREFVPYLSIIDVLMFNSAEDIRAMLGEYELL